MGLICVGVCTAKRPGMLAKCLKSLGCQIIPPGVEAHIVVVDNEGEPNNRAAVESIADECPFPVRYVHEPRAGIPIARNRVLDEALAIDADWIAFIDDDETAAPDWLAMLMAPEYRHVPVLMGQQVMVPPDPPPFWYVPKNKDIQEGKSRDRAFTYNVRFHADIAKAGFRFDERLRFTGGSDTEFFVRAHYRGGYEIRQTAKAKTFEAIHSGRLTYRRIFARKYRIAAGKVLRGESRWGKTIAIPHNAVSGVFVLLLSALAFPFSRRKFKKLAIKAGDKFARSCGYTAAFMGIVPEPYRQIDGER